MAEYIEREAVVLKAQRYLMPNVDMDSTVRVEDAERWFLKLIKEHPAADVVDGVCSGLYEALKDIVWYDSHAEWLIKLRDDIEKAQKEGAEVYGNPFEVEKWHTEKHTIWMLLVGMFGDWGTSIRSGWIDNFAGCIDFINAVVADEEGGADGTQ